jgi:translation initiation factor 6 (eIF-6)
LSNVTKIDVYEGTANKDQGSYIACMVFYNNQTIVGAPFAGELTGKLTVANIKAEFIDKCPSNGF